MEKIHHFFIQPLLCVMQIILGQLWISFAFAILYQSFEVTSPQFFRPMCIIALFSTVQDEVEIIIIKYHRPASTLTYSLCDFLSMKQQIFVSYVFVSEATKLV